MDVKIKDLTLSYGDFTAVDGLSLDIAEGESLVLLGKSGCGKTSTMRCVAGLEDPSGGQIMIGDRVVVDAERGVNLPPNQRNVGLVFQSYAVWPHMTVLENVSFPLQMKKRSKKDTKAKAMETLELVGLAHVAEKGASMLSGGQMQRVALARSLAMEPEVMLLDEPLSNLDARLREDLRVELRHLQLELGLTSIYVTHDQGEALALADRIAVMQGGQIAQLATPVEMYRSPASTSIAQFLGVSNVFGLSAVNGSTLVLEGHNLSVTAEDVPADVTADHSVCFRPEHVQITEAAEAGTVNTWPGTVEVNVYQGSYDRCTVNLDGGARVEVQASHAGIGSFNPGDRAYVSISPKHVQVLPPEVPSLMPQKEA